MTLDVHRLSDWIDHMFKYSEWRARSTDVLVGNMFDSTVEPRSTDTRLIRTPAALYGQFRLSRQKAHIFSLKLTRFIRTPVNTDNGHFFVSESQTLMLSTPLYGHWLSAHCLFSLSQLCDNCRHCTLFKWWQIFTGEQTFITVPKKKQYQSSVTYLILNSLSFLRCLTLVLRFVF